MHNIFAPALAILAVAAVACPVTASQSADAATLTASTDVSDDDALVADLMAAIQSGDDAALDDWIARRVSPEPLMPRDDFKPLLQNLASVKGLKATSWNRRGHWLEIFLEDANGRSARVDIEVDAGKVRGVIPIAAPSPYPGLLVDAPASERALRKAIDDRVKFAAARDQFSGVVMVMKGDRVIYQGAFGEADKDHSAPITLDTRFHLGSMDKQFTAVAIGQLIEKGELSLDTRLIDLLPDYANREGAEKITIRHLLTHTSGLGGLFGRESYRRARLDPFDRVSALLPLFAAEKLYFEPGERASYSNEGFVVLGAVIEAVTGESWYDYVTANVFVPAGMTGAGYPAIDEIAPGRAIGYRFGEDDPLGFGARRPNWNFIGYRGNSCGGGYASAADMLRFLHALRAGVLLKPETAEMMTAVFPGGERNYGMGFSNRPAGERSLRGHSGGGISSGIESDAKIVWETGWSYAVMGNYDAPFASIISRDIGNMIAAQP